MTTQYANASYQEIIDVHTEPDAVSVIGIHTPCSDTPVKMLKGFWHQFKKFKYNGCNLTVVPIATLPVDPLQVSYDAGEPTIDPRDAVNPLMFHGCHGDDMGSILNSLYSDPVSGVGQFIDTEIGDSVDHNKFRTASGGYPLAGKVLESLYYRALTDKTWLKAHPQRGFRKNGLRPMIYSVASTVQIGNLPYDNGWGLLGSKGIHHDDDGEPVSGVSGMLGHSNETSNQLYGYGAFGRPVLSVDGGSLKVDLPRVNSPQGFLTPRLQRLGWMDTRSVLGVNTGVDATVPTGGDVGKAMVGMYNEAGDILSPTIPPKIFMGMCMLPPAYKTVQHFRLILNHSFSFARFRGASLQSDDIGSLLRAPAYYNFSGTDADNAKDIKVLENLDLEKEVDVDDN